MKPNDIEALKKRIKKSAPAPINNVTQTALQKLEDAHPFLTNFLNLIFEQNFFENSPENINGSELAQKYTKILQEIKSSSFSDLYLLEIQNIFKYLKGFSKNQLNASLLILCACICEFSITENSCSDLLSNILETQHLTQKIQEFKPAFNFSNPIFLQILLKKYDSLISKNSEDQTFILVSYLSTLSQNKPFMFMNFPFKNYPEEIIIIESILEDSNVANFEQNNLNVISKLVDFSWQTSKKCRQNAIKLLADYLTEHSIDFSGILEPSNFLIIASFLYFNKLSLFYYDDLLLNEKFKKIWNFFDPKTIKNAIVSNFLSIRNQYLELFAKLDTEIELNLSKEINNNDHFLLQKCIFFTLFDLQTRLEPKFLTFENDHSVIQFLGFFLNRKNPFLELNILFPRVDRIFCKIIAKDGMLYKSDLIKTISEFLILNGQIYMAENKTVMLETLIANLANEKNGFLFSEIVSKNYDNLDQEYRKLLIVFGLENLRENDPNSEFFESKIKELQTELFEFEVSKSQFYEKINDAKRFRKILTEKMLENCESLDSFKSIEEKKVFLKEIVDFCKEEIDLILSGKTEEEKLENPKISLLEKLLKTEEIVPE